MPKLLDIGLADDAFDKSLAKLLAAAGSRKVVGVRVLAETYADDNFLASENVKRNLKKLGSVGLTYDLAIKNENYQAAMELVRDCPETRFVNNHMGKPDTSGAEWKGRQQWEENMRAIAKFENVYCKLSGFYCGKNLL